MLVGGCPMRRFAVSGLLACGLAGAVSAQTPTPAPLNVTPSTGMPGMAVGRPYALQQAGQQISRAAPAAGAQVGTGAGGIPGALDPRSPMPPGQVIDLKNVVAPYPGQPNPAPGFWDRLTDRWFGFLLPDPPAPAKPPNWTPGIARRNKERSREQMMRRD